MDLDTTLSRHERIALQFSGGRDSLACLYLLRPHWDRLTVYWCDPGPSFPETVALMEQVREMVPHFARIEGRQPQVIQAYGIPSDIVPASATPIGRLAGGKAPLMQDRYSCCALSLMVPTHERMLADGITLIMRGQKAADRLKSPVKSGEVHDGIEYLFPIQDWDSRQVMAFLKEQGAPIPRFYETLNGAPDCMDCSAWWEEGAAAYLKVHHPQQYAQNQARLDVIRESVSEHITAFNQEFGHGI